MSCFITSVVLYTKASQKRLMVMNRQKKKQMIHFEKGRDMLRALKVVVDKRRKDVCENVVKC